MNWGGRREEEQELPQQRNEGELGESPLRAGQEGSLLGVSSWGHHC